MQELEKRIGMLRLLLADIANKQNQVGEMEKQYRTQLSRIVDFVVYREGDVGNALALMNEVQTKLNEVMQTAEHLGQISGKAGRELEVLLLTKRVAEARSQLAQLQERQQDLAERLDSLSGGPLDTGAVVENEQAEVEEIRAIYEEVQSEIARLNSLITDASERAARTVQPSTKEPG